MKPDEDQEEMLVTYTLMQKKRPLTKFEEDLGVSSEYDDCCCDTREVYQSYCQFLAATQNGRKTEFSKIQFNKKFREISKSKFIYKRPHRSRKGPSPYCYIGLKLPETFPKSEAAPSAPQEDCLMRYLKHIEKYQLTGQIKTTLDIPPAKK